VELFATSPDIVHPIGIVCDAKGRLLVIESHTHFPPKDYAGPKHDRIRLLEDTKGTGKADRITTFYEGLQRTMDIAAHPDGSIYVATRNEILRLRDTKNVGRADEATRIVFLATKGDYPHNGLCGLCFDLQGDLIFGLGENMGVDYKLIGSDGTTWVGGGEGGNIFHCTADGKKLRRMATGFWNPFGTCVDIHGRIFAVDNDPDSMPPCRLLHVVEGGDYGYQYRYGRSGRHPFQAWNGQLPGTLPMMSGTGEAPCEIISYEAGGLPREYLGSLFVAAWADHRIERYLVKPRGVSFSAERLPFVQGGKDFRPVGLAVAPDGSLFISDWVRVDYQLHGQGAIWHLKARHPEKSTPEEVRRQLRQQLPPVDPRPLAVAEMKTKSDVRQLLQLLSNDDPFLCHAAIQQLAHFPNLWIDIPLSSLTDARQRIGLLLASRASGDPRLLQRLPDFLKDPEEEVRFLAVKWIADEKLSPHRLWLQAAIQDPKLSGRMHFACATALARIEGRDVNEHQMADHFAQRLLDTQSPPALKTLALQFVPATHKKLTPELFRNLLRQENQALRLVAVRLLCEYPGPQRKRLLLEVVDDEGQTIEVRAQALAGLAEQTQSLTDKLLTFATGPQPMLRDEALRALVNTTLSPSERNRLSSVAYPPDTGPLVARVLKQPFTGKRPPATDLTAWMQRLEGPADAAAGRRIFFHAPLTGCGNCHRIEGRGKDIGPDLAAIGRTDRRHILESILQPSANIAPQYQTWVLTTTQGKTYTGMLIHTYLDEQTYIDMQGTPFKLNTKEIVDSRMVPISIMPEGLADRLTDQEMRDLLAYLTSRR
jgi:hypothetical protein